MQHIIFTSLLAILISNSVLAQSDERLRPSRSKTEVQKPKTARLPTNPCAEYGPDFGRIDGTNTCIKIGGSLSVGTSFGSGR